MSVPIFEHSIESEDKHFFERFLIYTSELDFKIVVGRAALDRHP